MFEQIKFFYYFKTPNSDTSPIILGIIPGMSLSYWSTSHLFIPSIYCLLSIHYSLPVGADEVILLEV